MGNESETTTSSSSKVKNVKIKVNEPDMALRRIISQKEALRIIQESLIPTATMIANKEKRWWDAAAKDRNLSKEIQYKVNSDCLKIEPVNK